MPTINRHLLLFILWLTSFTSSAQKVGLVLSGGGAYGYAHIGVLKALEENGIPIDYITGTSAGALVGGMYAAGLPPKMIDSLVQTDKYLMMATGGIEKEFQHFFRKDIEDANWIKIRLTQDFSLSKIVPTSFINPALVDYEGMVKYAPISAAVQYNFDSLFVPFRCIAADIAKKESVIFKEGDLYQAVRASMTFPGYLRPIKVDGKLLFDGGLYNNFPTDIMYDEFFPDIIIGVNFSASDSSNLPDQDDVFSQLRSMIINRQPTSIVCDNGILLQPQLDISLFGFDKAQQAIDAGYQAAMGVMDSIKMLIERRVEPKELLIKRYKFHKQTHELIFENVVVKGTSAAVADYIKKSLVYNDKLIDEPTLKKRYFRLIADNKLKFLWPVAVYNPATGNFILELEVALERPFAIRFGGVFSSSPINTAFLGLEYFSLRKVGVNADLNSYFGKYYGSISGNVKFDFNFSFPFSIQAYGVINRWDYFKSFATFFEQSKPSYIIENEQFAGADLILPVSNFGKITAGYSLGEINNNYYQTENFSPSDTADATQLIGSTVSIAYEQNSLNRKHYATEGFALKITAKYFNGIENSYPGSTSPLVSTAENIEHEWYMARLWIQKYYKLSKAFQLGTSLELAAVYSDKFLDNYTSNSIFTHSFQPIPESRTLFIPQHAMFNYAAAGGQAIYHISSSFDFRLEGYYFRSYLPVLSNAFNQAYYGEGWGDRQIIGSGSVVYHSPLGPISGSINYYTAQEKRYSFIINFGYVLFNRRFIK
jgi:NTE family protein